MGRYCVPTPAGVHSTADFVLCQNIRAPDTPAQEFDYCRTRVANGVFNLTNHPEIIGRGPRVEMLDGLVAYMKSRDGVAFSTLRDEARRRLDAAPAAVRSATPAR